MELEGSLPHLQEPATCPCASQPIYYVRSILMCSRLRLGLPKCLFPSGFPHKNLCACHISSTCCMPRRSSFCWFGHPINIWWGMKLPIVHFSPLFCYFVPVMSKYPPRVFGRFVTPPTGTKIVISYDTNENWKCCLRCVLPFADRRLVWGVYCLLLTED